MKNKMVKISDREEAWVKEEAKTREITFSDMLRRIIDDRYEKKSHESVIGNPKDKTPVLDESNQGTRF